MSIHRLKPYVFGLFGISLFILLLTQTNLSAIYQAVIQITYLELFILLSLQVLTIALILKQWSNLFHLSHVPLNLKQLLNMHFYGVFFESITPALKTGGELFKVYYLKGEGIKKEKSMAVIVLQKLLSMTAFLLVSLVSISLLLLFIQTELSHSFIIIFVVFFAIVLSAFVLLYVFYKRGFFKPFYESLMSLKNHKMMLLKQFPLAVFIWTISAVKMVLLLQFLAVDVPIVYAAGLTFITYMVGMVPISPGGLGTVETTFVVMLGAMSVLAPTALAVAILFRFVTYWFVFILSLLYLGTMKLHQRWRLHYGR